MGSLPPANTQQWLTFSLNSEPSKIQFTIYSPEQEFRISRLIKPFCRPEHVDTFDEKELSRVQDLLDRDTLQTRWLNRTNPLGRHYSEFEQIVARTGLAFRPIR